MQHVTSLKLAMNITKVFNAKVEELLTLRRLGGRRYETDSSWKQ